MHALAASERMHGDAIRGEGGEERMELFALWKERFVLSLGEALGAEPGAVPPSPTEASTARSTSLAPGFPLPDPPGP
eukprot:CAMPEP_0176183458 /NCGR_PEP_ID=MMETSP0121_2-20121125/300_1 /TAXON_ID=160619 /ORGANISM="Kryptoperidinium foliaceum, Strain CCMP 1326" /LENGTH=76 /DNA_ID=CAMNT_0017521783 /DNA_START=140 /DNA_END=367 /DNA_ORIENTATION=-